MAAAAARTLPKYGKSSLPLFLRPRILPQSNLDLNLNTLPNDPQFLQSNQNLQTLKPLSDSSQLGKAFLQFTGAAQVEQSRKITNRDLFGSSVLEARGGDKRPVSDDSDDSDFDDDLDDIDDDDFDSDDDDIDCDDEDEDEDEKFVKKRK